MARARSVPIDEARIAPLNDEPARDGRYVLYWMQQSQRAEHNHALEHAVQRANALNQPVVVAFGLMDDYPEANLRHYRFMLEGLRETQGTLADRGITMLVRHGHPADVALELAGEASLVVCDRGYLRHQKRWRDRVADEAGVEVVQVEADVVVPVETASDKAEYAARTLRPRIHRHLDRFLVELPTTPVRRDSGGLRLGRDGATLDLADLDAVLDGLKLDRSVAPVPRFTGGTSVARGLLGAFIRDHLAGYADHRNQPQTDFVSHMSKYLHFGQISPVEVALAVRDATRKPTGDRDAYLEELIVRRELACNFVHYTPDYDRYRCVPDWAKRTLRQHRDDPREHLYTRRQLEHAQTHDPCWNAAMREMLHTGYMHNYMRMYWGKKILEWTRTPEEAFETTLALNNRYFIDGRDPASFANVAWLFGVHDRPWPERAVYGKVRSMSADGLKRKADPDAYVAKVDAMVNE